jgi:hypothetical protein
MYSYANTHTEFHQQAIVDRRNHRLLSFWQIFYIVYIKAFLRKKLFFTLVFNNCIKLRNIAEYVRSNLYSYRRKIKIKITKKKNLLILL